MKKKIMYAMPVVIAIVAMILLAHRDSKPVTPLDAIISVIGVIFLISMQLWSYYDNLKDQTPKQQRWDFMSFVGMVISGTFLLTMVTATM